MKRLWASRRKLDKPNRIITDRRGKTMTVMTISMMMRTRTKTRKKMNSQKRRRSRVIQAPAAAARKIIKRDRTCITRRLKMP